jgi:hypothetical protein
MIFGLTWCLFSCNETSNDFIVKKIIKNDTITEIEMTQDSLYHGKYKVYLKSSGKSIEDITYNKGILNGPCNFYFPNGKLKQSLTYDNGFVNGFVKIYDSSGVLIEKYYKHFDVNLGDVIVFNNDKPIFYGFKAPFGGYLFQWDYLRQNLNDKIDLQEFFFFEKGISTDSTSKLITVFLINPPFCKFQYSYYKIDYKNGDTSIATEISSKLPFDVLDIPINLDEYRIKLDVYNEQGQLVIIMHKKI